MEDQFSFNYEEYDFWPVYETIKKYYPLGLKASDDQLNQYYPGLIALRELIYENIVVQKTYRARWVKFNHLLKEQIRKPVHDTHHAAAPCYSGLVLLKRQKEPDLLEQELHFAISLLGPYYTLIIPSLAWISP